MLDTKSYTLTHWKYLPTLKAQWNAYLDLGSPSACISAATGGETASSPSSLLTDNGFLCFIPLSEDTYVIIGY